MGKRREEEEGRGGGSGGEAGSLERKSFIEVIVFLQYVGHRAGHLLGFYRRQKIGTFSVT